MTTEEENKKISTPPQPEIAIRTMASDMKSLEQSGGQAPKAEILNNPFHIREDIEVKPQERVIVPGYSGPEKAIFSPSATVSQKSMEADKNSSKPVFTKYFFILTGLLIVIIGLGLLGYYVIFPWLFSLKIFG